MQAVGDAAAHQRRAAVQGLAHGIDDAAQPGNIGISHGVMFGDDRLAADADALERAKRHEQRPVVAKADDLAGNLATATADDAAARADADHRLQAHGLDQQALDAGYPPVALEFL